MPPPVADVELVAPAWRSVPPHTTTSGPDAADLAESAGLALDAEQRLVVDAMLAETPDGMWASFENAVIIARQNGKTVSLQALALFKLFLLQDRLTVWTAHEFATAIEAFRDIQVLIDQAPHLSRKVRHVNNTNGEEGIELHSGARLIFRARSKRAGRGLSGNTVILDEAFALTPTHLGSLLPTLSAVPNSQVVYASSAGHLQSGVLRAVRDRGRTGGDPSLAYLEWAAPTETCTTPLCDHRLGVAGCALDDEELWRRANPALGRRLALTAIRAERRALPALEFARERMGWWEDPAAGDAVKIPAADWAAAADRDSQLEDRPSFAIDVTPDRARASLAVAGRRADGLGHLELIDNRPGTAWVVPVTAGVCRRAGVQKVSLDAAGPAASLIEALEREGLTVQTVSARELSQACGNLVDWVAQRRGRHIDQYELNAALEGAGTRDLGDGGWAWSRRSSLVDISPLVAATVALWRSDSAPHVDVEETIW